jgi:hypothetical protein
MHHCMTRPSMGPVRLANAQGQRARVHPKAMPSHAGQFGNVNGGAEEGSVTDRF